MTSSDLLQVLLGALDDVDRVFDHSETSRWPPGEMEVLKELGLVRRASDGLHAPCPNCDEPHIEPVTIRQTPDGTQRYFIRCPESMRVEVTTEMCNGWEVDPDGLASAAAMALNLKESPKALLLGRLWRLGRIPWEGQTREVLLARRLGDNDAAMVAVRIGPGGRSVVLVPHHTPDDHIWPGRIPAVVALSRITTVEDGRVIIDAIAMFDLIAEADRTATDRANAASATSPTKKVQQQVKQVIDSMLSNEALVQAYRVHGSYRKTADALNEEGHLTDRWAVERAVKAAGGPKAVKNAKDSASVARTVASQSRDRSKKFLERR